MSGVFSIYKRKHILREWIVELKKRPKYYGNTFWCKTSANYYKHFMLFFITDDEYQLEMWILAGTGRWNAFRKNKVFPKRYTFSKWEWLLWMRVLISGSNSTGKIMTCSRPNQIKFWGTASRPQLLKFKFHPKSTEPIRFILFEVLGVIILEVPQCR